MDNIEFEENPVADSVLNKLQGVEPEQLTEGILEETEEHNDTLEKLEAGEIDKDEALEEIVEEHLEKDPEYYEKESNEPEPLEEVISIDDEPKMFIINQENLGLDSDVPSIQVGTIFYSTNGTENWVVEYFTEDGVQLKHVPKSPLSVKIDDKHLSFEEISKLFKEKLISINNILNDREFSLAITLLKQEILNMQKDSVYLQNDSLSRNKEFALGGALEEELEQERIDREIMEYQFGKDNINK